MRVLLVDDDAGLRALLAHDFRRLRHRRRRGRRSRRGARADPRGSSRRDRARRRDARHGRARVLPRAEVEPRRRGTSPSSCSRARKAARASPQMPPARRRTCRSPSARSSCSQWSSVSREVSTAFRSARRGSIGSQEEQLLLYARDLRHLLQIERAQRSLVQDAYRETVAAFASALESKDTRTRAHSQRVQRYALELARTMDAELARRSVRRVRVPARTTSARSGSRTGCCRSPRRSPSRSAR